LLLPDAQSAIRADREKAAGKKAMSVTVECETQEVQRLIALMKSPGCWRDRDPEVVRAVRTGFQRL
jgi:hypothetical protein